MEKATIGSHKSDGEGCWHFLASSLGLVFPRNGTRNALTIFLNANRNIPQAYGYIVVAFLPEIFGYHSFIFSQRMALLKVSSRDMDDIT